MSDRNEISRSILRPTAAALVVRSEGNSGATTYP